MKAFVTGATGFIGGRVAHKLVERGYDVWALVRDAGGARSTALAAGGVRLISGDIGRPESLRAAMRGSDVVYHIAGWYKIGARDGQEAQAVNVAGTRNVLGVAQDLAIPRIIYTSTLAVFGDTHGYVPDENYLPPGTSSGTFPQFLTEYDRTKWLAHYRVAEPMQRAGAPVIIVMPGGVYGPGDPSLIGELMRRFYLAQLPMVPGPEGMLTYAYVDDVAEGHVLAGERGQSGRNYILAGPALRLGQAYDLWAEITGLPAPALRVPAALLRPLAPLAGLLHRVAPLPEIFSEEAMRIPGATYLGQSGRARDELGWETRPLRDGMAETFAWIAAQVGAAPEGWASRNRPALAGLAVSAALALAVYRSAIAGRRRR